MCDMSKDEIGNFYNDPRFKYKVINESSKLIKEDIGIINKGIDDIPKYNSLIFIFILFYKIFIDYKYIYIVMISFIFFVGSYLIPRIYIKFSLFHFCNGVYEKNKIYYLKEIRI